MGNKSKGRWMKSVVGFCLAYCVLFSIAVYVAKWFGVEAVDMLALVFGLFGGELLMTLVIKIIDDKGIKIIKKQKEKCEEYG